MFSRIRAVLISAAVALAFAAQAHAQQVIELKVSHYVPPNHTIHKELLRWGEELAKQSGGRLKLNIFPASQLGPVNRQFDLVRNGVVDIAVGLHASTPGRFPMTELTSLPYVHPASGVSSEIASRRLTELAPEFLASEHAGLKILWMNVTNPLLFHTSKKEIKSIDDFSGLRIRYAGEQFAQMIKSLKAVPLPVPPAETQDALAKGIIDGATFPYEATQSFDLGGVVKYTLEPGVSTATFAVVMNPAKFASLPADLQKILENTTGPDRAAAMGKAFDDSEKRGKEFMLSKGDHITVLGDAELQALKARLNPMISDAVTALSRQGKPADTFLAAYQR